MLLHDVSVIAGLSVSLYLDVLSRYQMPVFNAIVISILSSKEHECIG